MRGTFAALLLVLAFAGNASAQPASPLAFPKPVVFAAEIQVELGAGAERCPDPVYLRVYVANDLGYDPFIPGAKGTPAGRFVVRVARTPRGLRATNEHTDAEGKRRWTKTYEDVTTTRSACESVYRGVALQIETELTRFEEPPPPAPTCPEPAPCPTCPAPKPEPFCSEARFSVWPPDRPLPPLAPDPPKPLDRWPVAVRLGVAAWPELIVSGLGSVGVSAEMGVRYRAVSLGVEAHGDPPIGSVTFPGSGTVSFARMSGALLLCGHFGWFAGCAVGDVGRFIFPDRIPAIPPSALYGAAGVRAGMEFPIAPPRLFIRTTLDVRAPIDPVTYTAQHGGVFAPVGLSVGLGLGLLVELPAASARATTPAGAPVAPR
jgi:hypothetical protein